MAAVSGARPTPSQLPALSQAPPRSLGQSGLAINDVPIEKITVPTIIIHAKDDPLCVFAPAEQAAHRIPGCILVAQESGGHFGLGQNEPARGPLDDFLKAPMVALAVSPAGMGAEGTRGD